MLRRLLYLAKEWKLIISIPTIRMLAGERIREFVLNHDQERDYLDFAPHPLKDAGLLIAECQFNRSRKRYANSSSF